jgi:hypothetical protein
MAGVPGGTAGFLAITIIAFIILGSVLEGLPAIVLFGPLLFPVAKAMGVHEVHYAMIVILAMGIGLFAPPFASAITAPARSAGSRRTMRCCASGLYRRARRRPRHRRRHPLAVDRVSLMESGFCNGIRDSRPD